MKTEEITEVLEKAKIGQKIRLWYKTGLRVHGILVTSNSEHWVDRKKFSDDDKSLSAVSLGTVIIGFPEGKIILSEDNKWIYHDSKGGKYEIELVIASKVVAFRMACP